MEFIITHEELDLAHQVLKNKKEELSMSHTSWIAIIEELYQLVLWQEEQEKEIQAPQEITQVVAIIEKLQAQITKFQLKLAPKITLVDKYHKENIQEVAQ